MEKQGQPPKPQGIDIMFDKYHLLVLVIKHTCTFLQWRMM